jgi:hypothetical protein
MRELGPNLAWREVAMSLFRTSPFLSVALGAALGAYSCATGAGPGFSSTGASGESASGANESTAGSTSSTSGLGGGNAAPPSSGAVSNAVNSGSGATTGSPNAATGAASGSVSVASTDASASPEPCPTPSTLIDDMENGLGSIAPICGRTGYWYTYNDMTAGALQTPAAGKPFTDSAIVPPRTTDDGGTSSMAARTTGSGFTAYGAGMGFDLDDPGAGAAKHTYDASSYSGVTFWAMGSAGGSVRFNVPDKATDPSGGICMGSTGTDQCNDHHGHALMLTTTWAQFTFTWAQLTQQGFGYAEATLDTSNLVGMQFQVAAPTGSFDVWIDDIAFTQ